MKAAINPKLMQLPIDALQKLKKEVDEAMQWRRYELFKVGKLASFVSSKGQYTVIKITGVGPKNIMGAEVNERGIPTGGKWKVAPSFLTVLPDPPKVVEPQKGVGADAPQSELAGLY